MNGQPDGPFSSIEDTIEDIGEGKMVIVCDDEDRETRLGVIETLATWGDERDWPFLEPILAAGDRTEVDRVYPACYNKSLHRLAAETARELRTRDGELARDLLSDCEKAAEATRLRQLAEPAPQR